jgi:hypothetical protein
MPAEVLPPSETLVLIVTGSTIAAETRDRPLAYGLRERMRVWIEKHRDHDATRQAGNGANGEVAKNARLHPVVCTDLWYLNARDLAGRPAVAIGEPASNAATALISNRLPTAFVVEGSLRVHLDPEYIDLRASIWGATAAGTAAALEVFAERYLDEFLSAAMVM